MNRRFEWYFTCFIFKFFVLFDGISNLKAQLPIDAIRFEATQSCGIDKLIEYNGLNIVSISYSGVLELDDQVFGPSQGIDCILACYDSNNNLQWTIEAASSNNDQTTSIFLDTITQKVYWSFLFWDEIVLKDTVITVNNGSRASLTLGADINNGAVDLYFSVEGQGQKRITTGSTNLSGDLVLFGYFSESIIVNDTILETSSSGKSLMAFSFDSNYNLSNITAFNTEGNCVPISCTSDGYDFYVAGTLSGFVVINNDTLIGRLLDTDIFMIRFQSHLNAQWTSSFSEVYNKSVSDLIWHNNALYMAGNFMGPFRFREGLELRTTGLNFDGYIAKIDRNGYVESAVSLTGSGFINHGQLLLIDNEIYVSGQWTNGELIFEDDTLETSNFNSHGYIAKYNMNFKPINLVEISSDGFINSVWFYKQKEGSYLYAFSFSQDVHIFDFTSNTPTSFAAYMLVFERPVMTAINNNHSFLEKISVYPNPASSILNFDRNGDFQYLIITNNGKIVNKGNTKDGYIDISHLTPQVYYIQFISRGDIIAVQKFIKM